MKTKTLKAIDIVIFFVILFIFGLYFGLSIYEKCTGNILFPNITFSAVTVLQIFNLFILTTVRIFLHKSEISDLKQSYDDSLKDVIDNYTLEICELKDDLKTKNRVIFEVYKKRVSSEISDKEVPIPESGKFYTDGNMILYISRDFHFFVDSNTGSKAYCIGYIYDTGSKFVRIFDEWKMGSFRNATDEEIALLKREVKKQLGLQWNGKGFYNCTHKTF